MPRRALALLTGLAIHARAVEAAHLHSQPLLGWERLRRQATAEDTARFNDRIRSCTGCAAPSSCKYAIRCWYGLRTRAYENGT